METKIQVASDLAKAINEQLRVSDVRICYYTKRFIVRKGSTVVAKGDSLYINGRGSAFLAGAFKVYAL